MGFWGVGFGAGIVEVCVGGIAVLVPCCPIFRETRSFAGNGLDDVLKEIRADRGKPHTHIVSM